MSRNLDKLWLLLWKNYLIQYRHPIRTLFEIILLGVFITWSYIKPSQDEYDNDGTIGVGVGLFIIFNFMFPVANFVRYITSEKERQLKQYMIIMGLPCWLQWIGWFIHIMLFMIATISICVATLKVKLVFFFMKLAFCIRISIFCVMCFHV